MQIALIYTIPIIALHAAMRSSGDPSLQVGLQLAWGALCVALYLRAAHRKKEASAPATRRFQLGLCTLLLAAFYTVEYYGFPFSKLDEVPMGLAVGSKALIGLLPMLLGFRIEKRIRSTSQQATK